MGIHLGRVGHIGIHVSDVDRSIDFYRRVLALKLTGRWGPAGHRAPDPRSCGVEIVSGSYVHAPEGGEKGFVGGSGSHAFYFLDPDGNRIEVYCWLMKVTGPSMAAPHPDL